MFPNPPLLLLLLLSTATLLLVPAPVSAHGCMPVPNQRGTLCGSCKYGQGKCAKHTVDVDAPNDYQAHFPAGQRTGRLGEGVAYQKRQAGPYGWVPFKPLDPRFRWRAGVCGDRIGRREPHRKGGEFFYNGKIVATYQQGGVLKLGLRINAHHNGFVEVHICDATKCKGDISRSCFRKGHCKQLHRAYQPGCQSGYHRFCGPIDRKYPGRWYLPCSQHPVGSSRIDNYGEGGKGFIYYQLPEHFYSNHAIIQWFWTAANVCNPPGVIEYFEGPDRPRGWGNCKGQANAKGGYVHRGKPCGGRHFPEEYLQCADIRVIRKRRNRRPRWMNRAAMTNGTAVNATDTYPIKYHSY